MEYARGMCTGWIGQVNFLFAVLFLAPFSCTSFRLLIAATFYFATTVVIIATITNGIKTSGREATDYINR